MSNNHYTLGSDQHQAWMREYWYAPRGIGFTEPGIVSTDSAEFSAYNVAKSFYQNYPEVFNLKYISDKVGIPAAEVGERIKRMYDQHAIMFVYNPAVAVYGWGLYYWVRVVPEQGRHLHRIRDQRRLRLLQRKPHAGAG